VSGGMHGSNRLGGNSLSDLLVFGRRAGAGASDYVAGLAARPVCSDEAVTEAERTAVAPFAGADAGGENPYTLHMELQQAMNDLVGIIRRAEEMGQAIDRLDELKRRAATLVVEGHRQFNPGWHLALDLRNMLLVSECVARAALLRTESRGGHTRDDYPGMDADWRRKLLVCTLSGSPSAPGSPGSPTAAGSSVEVVEEPQIPIRSDLLALFEHSELEKYLTADELEG
jgi:succinate dehydrogenase / fumarate reductase flavoprotein subunit